MYYYIVWSFNIGFDENSDDIEGQMVDESAGLAQLEDGRVTCLTCGKTLSNPGNAKRHYQIHHQPNSPSTCPICKKVFKNNMYQKHHLRIMHNLSSYAMKHTFKPT